MTMASTTKHVRQVDLQQQQQQSAETQPDKNLDVLAASTHDFVNIPSPLMSATSTTAMTPPTLDLLVLTFNCAKTIVDATAFANDLQVAFSHGADALPDVLVLSLQELAPMSYSFIGGYFLQPYLDRFEKAVNIAALQASSSSSPVVTVTTSTNQNDDDDDHHHETPITDKKPFHLVKAHNVGYTGIMLFARDPTKVLDLQQAEVGFGAAEMGNKGAAGLRVLYGDAAASEASADSGASSSVTEMTFVATHLAAMEWNLARRNANWAAIMRALTFENPEDVLKQFRVAESSSSSSSALPTSSAAQDDGVSGSDDDERRLLLHGEHHERHMRLRQQLHDISVFKPSSHLFVAGDLNYRIAATSPPPGAPFPNTDPESPNYYPNFLPLDQLTREKAAGRTMHGLTEAKIDFPPTYKYVQGKASDTNTTGKTDGEDAASSSWSYAPHRYPSWTDRVLYLDTPSWLKQKEEEESGETAAQTRNKNDKKLAAAVASTSSSQYPAIAVKAYNSLPPLLSSDHQPVYLRVSVPMIPPSELRPPLELTNPSSSSPSPPHKSSSSSSSSAAAAALVDPRARLPVELDPEAWERRAAARRKEVVTGWSMFLWSTKQGAWILGTVVFAGLGAYWMLGGGDRAL